jgi:SurA N-terminal domain
VRVTDAAVSRLSARISAASSPTVPAAPRPRRRRRIAAATALTAAAALLLSACGNSQPGTAATVGDQRITDSDLQDLVNASLAAPGVQAGLSSSDFKGDLGKYRRELLNIQVDRLLIEEGARKLGLDVSQSLIDQRYKEVEDSAGGAKQMAAVLASRSAYTPELYRQQLTAQVFETEIGYARGGAKRLTDAQLQALYQQFLPTATMATLSLIPVSSKAVADQAVAAITRAPATFNQVAARLAPGNPQTAPQKYALNQIPPDLIPTLRTKKAGDLLVYSQAAPSGGQVYAVIRFGGLTSPTLAQARPQLEAQAQAQAQTAGQTYLKSVAREVGVEVNPRYGTWEPDQLGITDFVNPVISPTPTPAPSTGLPGQGGDGTSGGDAGSSGGNGGDAGSNPAPAPTG